MLIVITSVYPPHLVQQVGEAYIATMTKYPDDPSLGEPLVRAAVKATAEGIRSIGISRINKGKLEEALQFAAKRMLVFAKLEGFSYNIEVAFDADEAMTLLGMEAPK